MVASAGLVHEVPQLWLAVRTIAVLEMALVFLAVASASLCLQSSRKALHMMVQYESNLLRVSLMSQIC